MRETCGVHDGADDRVDAFGLQLGDRRGGKRGGCHSSHCAAFDEPWPVEGVRSVLAADQLGDEPIDETVQSRPSRGAYDELRQSCVDIGVELPVQLIPVGGDQLAGIEFGTTPADRRGQLRGYLAVGPFRRANEMPK